MPKENSAVEMLLDKINDLQRRIEIIEARQYPGYTTTVHVPTTNVSWTYTSIWATPTVTRTEAVAYRNAYEDRLHDLERQLDDMNNARFEVRDGNLYFTWIGNDWETN